MRWNWKKWPYWVRGGVIAAVVGILSWILFNYCGSSQVESGYGGDLSGITCLPLLGPSMLLIPLLAAITPPSIKEWWDFIPSMFLFIPHLIAWLLSGFLVGWMYKKIKESAR